MVDLKYFSLTQKLLQEKQSKKLIACPKKTKVAGLVYQKAAYMQFWKRICTWDRFEPNMYLICLMMSKRAIAYYVPMNQKIHVTIKKKDYKKIVFKKVE